MTSIYSQETATYMYGNERYAKGKKDGMLNILVEMVKDKVITVAEAAKRLGVSKSKFAKLGNL